MKKLKNGLKIIIVLAIMLFTALIIYSKISNQTLAATVSSATESAQRAIETATDWTSKVTESSKVILKNPSAGTLSSLVDSSQVMDDGSIYIRYEDLLSIPSLFCSAKGAGMPGYASTGVTGNGETRYYTDQGIQTAYLTESDLASATIFRDKNEWTDWTTSGPSNIYSTTTSKTYGRYTLDSVKNCTPAEAWVLAEFDKNVASSDITYESTGTEYSDTISIISTIDVDGTTLYLVGNTGEEVYVEKRDGKYYYVTITSDNASYAPYSYVQHAWWKVKTVGENVTSAGIKDTDLAHEAEDFENYVKGVNNVSDVSQLEKNDDGTYKINYDVSMEPTDTSEVNVSFNSTTNKYIIGPFKVNYDRYVTKQGDRAKVSFSGISDCILVGVDSDGNELVNSDGTSLLQLGTNYRFVYSNTTDASTNYGHDTARNALDTDEDYPYPSSGEEFYLEIDYIDDLVAIKNFKFDFQYLTAGGQYEYYTGSYMVITWVPYYDILYKVEATSAGSASLEGTDAVVATLDVSSRSEESSAGNSATADLEEKEYYKEESVTITDPTGGDSLKRNGDITWDHDNGTVTIPLKFTVRSSRYDVKNFDFNATNNERIRGISNQNHNGNVYTFTITVSINNEKAYVSETITESISYSYTYTTSIIDANGETASGTDTANATVEFYINLIYTNELLPDEITINSSDKAIEIVENKLYIPGVVSSEELEASVELLNESNEEVYWDIQDGTGHFYQLCGTEGDFNVEKSGTITIFCYTKSRKFEN